MSSLNERPTAVCLCRYCQSILAWYQKRLETYPVLTKAFTSSLLMAGSDALSQIIVNLGKSKKHFEFRSTAAFSLFGFVVSGPVIHYFYKYLEKYVPRKQHLGFLKKVIIDRLLFGPPYLFLILYFHALVEGYSPRLAAQRVMAMYRSSFFKNLIYWSVIQVVNMYYIPVDLQILYTNLAALVWNTYLAVLRR